MTFRINIGRLDHEMEQGSGCWCEQKQAKMTSIAVQRISCLRNDQLTISATDKQFFYELRNLERKYFLANEPLFEKRAKVVNGELEPAAEECQWRVGEAVAAVSELRITESVGIPKFWLTVLLNSSNIADMVEERDKLALRHLTDIKGRYADEGYGFAVEFHFSPNEFFENSVLSVKYKENCEAVDHDPFSFDMRAVNCWGTGIQWKTLESTLTVKKKKMRNTKTGHKLERFEKVDSFFNFFDPPVVSGDCKDADQLLDKLNDHYEIGLHLIENIIPNAVLYYTGEMDDEEESSSDYSSSDDDDSESPSSDDERPRNKHLRKLKAK